MGVLAHVPCLDAEVPVGPESVVERHHHHVEVDVEWYCETKRH